MKSSHSQWLLRGEGKKKSICTKAFYQFSSFVERWEVSCHIAVSPNFWAFFLFHLYSSVCPHFPLRRCSNSSSSAKWCGGPLLGILPLPQLCHWEEERFHAAQQQGREPAAPTMGLVAPAVSPYYGWGTVPCRHNPPRGRRHCLFLVFWVLLFWEGRNLFHATPQQTTSHIRQCVTCLELNRSSAGGWGHWDRLRLTGTCLLEMGPGDENLQMDPTLQKPRTMRGRRVDA